MNTNKPLYPQTAAAALQEQGIIGKEPTAHGDLQEHLDRIFGISSVIIYILDPDGRFTFVNCGVEDILNFTPEELIGKHFSFILPPDEYERVSRSAVLPRLAGKNLGIEGTPGLFDERRRGRRRTRNLEVKLMRRREDDYRVVEGGVTGVVEVEGAYTMPEDGGEPIFIGSQGVIFDITKYKESERERLELHKRLFDIQRVDAVGKLSGRVAHDLNNKLSSIIGTAELMKQGLADADRETLNANLDIILAASQRAAELSRTLDTFCRKGEGVFERLNVHKLLDGVTSFVDALASRAQVTVERHLRAEASEVTGSEAILQSALLNLVTNALDSMRGTSDGAAGGPAVGTLTVETSNVVVEEQFRTASNTLVRPGRYVMISVRDTGAGMCDEVRSRIFEPFFTTDSKKGLGLGLTSIRETTRNHGGAIDFETAPGKGSRFSIYLPCHA